MKNHKPTFFFCARPNQVNRIHNTIQNSDEKSSLTFGENSEISFIYLLQNVDLFFFSLSSFGSLSTDSFNLHSCSSIYIISVSMRAGNFLKNGSCQPTLHKLRIGNSLATMRILHIVMMLLQVL